MAKPKKTIQIPPPPPDDDEELEITPPLPEDDATSELSAILAEVGGSTDASISVNKVTLQGEERLGKFMPREFDVDSLRDRYGGGVYWLYFHVGGKLHTKRRVVFAKTLDEVRGNDPAARAPAAAPGGDSLLQAIDRMAQQNRDMMQSIVQLMTANRTPPTDPMMIIDAASKLANLGGKRDSGTDDLERLMRLAKFAREFGGGGEEGGGSGLGAIALEFFRAMREGGGQPQPQLAAPGAPGQQPTEMQQMMIFVRRAIAQHMPTLLKGAQAESDPGVYAQLVLDQVPDLYIGSLVGQLQKPDWFALLVQVDARAAAHQPWFEALRNEILAGTSPDSPPSP